MASSIGGIEAARPAENKHVLIIKSTCDAHGANLACQVADVARETLISAQIISHATPSCQIKQLQQPKQIHLSGLEPEMVQAMVDMSFAAISTAREIPQQRHHEWH